MRGLLSALRSFLGEGWHPRTPLGRELVPILAAKVVAIVLIKVLFFSGDARPTIDADTVARAILPPAAATEPGPRQVNPMQQ